MADRALFWQKLKGGSDLDFAEPFTMSIPQGGFPTEWALGYARGHFALCLDKQRAEPPSHAGVGFWRRWNGIAPDASGEQETALELRTNA